MAPQEGSRWRCGPNRVGNDPGRGSRAGDLRPGLQAASTRTRRGLRNGRRQRTREMITPARAALTSSGSCSVAFPALLIGLPLTVDSRSSTKLRQAREAGKAGPPGHNDDFDGPHQEGGAPQTRCSYSVPYGTWPTDRASHAPMLGSLVLAFLHRTVAPRSACPPRRDGARRLGGSHTRQRAPGSRCRRRPRHCEQVVPPHALQQVRVEALPHRTRSDDGGAARAVARGLRPGDWSTSEIARLRYVAARGEWTLYWRDRNGRWHRYARIKPSSAITTLL